VRGDKVNRRGTATQNSERLNPLVLEKVRGRGDGWDVKG
jgi:hypothetical protein